MPLTGCNPIIFLYCITIRLRKEGFPVEYLPKVVEPGTTVGHVVKSWHHVPKGAAVLAAMGDLQCSTLAVLPGPHDAGVCNVCLVCVLVCVCMCSEKVAVVEADVHLSVA